MELRARRINIRRLTMDDLHPLLEMRLRNRSFFQPFEPIHPEAHYTIQGQRAILESVQSNWDQDVAYGFGIFLGESHELIGRVNLSNIVRGSWQNCTLGYFLDEAENGNGYMTEAVWLAMQFAFDHANLHRVQAAAMPRNLGSIRVLDKVGFRYDGFAEYYLNINDAWEDHNLYSLTRERWNV